MMSPLLGEVQTKGFHVSFVAQRFLFLDVIAPSLALLQQGSCAAHSLESPPVPIALSFLRDKSLSSVSGTKYDAAPPIIRPSNPAESGEVMPINVLAANIDAAAPVVDNIVL